MASREKAGSHLCLVLQTLCKMGVTVSRDVHKTPQQTAALYYLEGQQEFIMHITWYVPTFRKLPAIFKE